MLRVLVVDDSPLLRDLLTEILHQDPGIQVVATAADGREAVELVERLRPDLVTMDVQMPRMDGYAATEEIMIRHPTPIVIVSGSNSRPDVEKTMNSLRAGALTVIHKPQSVQSARFDDWAKLLIATVKAMAEVKVIRRRRPPPSSNKNSPEKPPCDLPLVKPKVIALVASTGGPQALYRLLSQLPGDFPVPMLLVQHISLGFLSGFATWLNSTVPISVKIAQPQEKLAPGTVYLAPEEHHLGVTAQERIQWLDWPPVEGFRPSGTVLFQAVADAYGPLALAGILTGMGQDGVEGLKSIRQAGGHVMAQDEPSSVVFGMPRAAIEAGLADHVLSLDGMAAFLRQIGNSS